MQPTNQQTNENNCFNERANKMTKRHWQQNKSAIKLLVEFWFDKHGIAESESERESHFCGYLL